MTEIEICKFINSADKCRFEDVKENWTLVAEWNTEHMKQYRLYLDENGNKKAVIVDLK